MTDFQRQYVDPNRIPLHLVEKWTPSLLSEGFVPFPKRFMRCFHRIFDGAEAVKDIAVVLAVVDYKRPNLSRNPSLAYLSFLAGLDPDEFTASLDRLKKKGFLQVEGDFEEMEIKLDGLFQAVERETQ